MIKPKKKKIMHILEKNLKKQPKKIMAIIPKIFTKLSLIFTPKCYIGRWMYRNPNTDMSRSRLLIFHHLSRGTQVHRSNNSLTRFFIWTKILETQLGSELLDTYAFTCIQQIRTHFILCMSVYVHGWGLALLIFFLTSESFFPLTHMLLRALPRIGGAVGMNVPPHSFRQIWRFLLTNSALLP